VKVLGVSTDSVADNARFAAKYGFPFPLLCDTGRVVCMAYGACEAAGSGEPKRMTYVIGPDGHILQIHHEVQVEGHARILLESDLGRSDLPSLETAAAEEPCELPPLVYAVGQIGYELTREARRDFFRQQGVRRPDDARELLAHLDRRPWDASALLWTFRLDHVAVYGLVPGGPFAAATHEQLRRLLRRQLAAEIEGVSLAGVVVGTVTLRDGRTVPLVRPELRGLAGWSAAAMVQEIAGAPAGAHRVAAAHDFFARILDQLRSPGRRPQERALYFGATRAAELRAVFRAAAEAEMELEAIRATPSPWCRPGSDCWDVELGFFDPRHRLERARRVARIVVDVSEVLPATLGEPRWWHQA
jgi:cyanobactin maturation PatA/PatG family protease